MSIVWDTQRVDKFYEVVFLYLSCGKDLFLLNDQIRKYKHESSYCILKSVHPPELTQMCFRLSFLSVSEGSFGKFRKQFLHLQPFLLWHRQSDLQCGSWSPVPGVVSPCRRSHLTDSAEPLRSAVLLLSMITLAWQRFYHEHCGNFLKLIGSY